jgi:UDPglucose--hexose-1-phosphate uridylyltransferase
LSLAPLLSSPHRRWNPLKREWVIVSPQRTQRPWQGQTEDAPPVLTSEYDPACYLCPGNPRAGGEQTPKYDGTFVFDNDYAALNTQAPVAAFDLDRDGLLRASSERGLCRVVCFSPRHNLTLATLPTGDIRKVVDVWAQQEVELRARPEFRYVQIFENRGAMMGASNPHPHGQIWATETIPNEPALELISQREFFAEHGRTLLASYLESELAAGERIVADNGPWVALVPFWAVWPFEMLLLPRRAVENLHELDMVERNGLAEMLHRVTAGYNRVFNTPFPYSMGFHTSPCDGELHPEWHLHAHFYPPLLRSASVRKFMVGFELLGSAQRDITPESAAATLRKAIHPAIQPEQPEDQA